MPNTGNLTNGLFQSGQGIAKTTYTFPMLNVGPRFGMAYDVTGKQRFVLRGAVGAVLRPAASRRRAGARRQSSGRIPDHHRALRTAAEPRQRRPDHDQPAGITVFQYDAKLPTSLQFSGGAQMHAAVGDVAGRVVRRPAQLERPAAVEHQRDRPRHGVPADDAGSDAGAERHRRARRRYAATNPDLVRGYRGYSSMASTSRFYEGWRTFHSIQLSFNRRFRDGLQFGFNDTITLSDVASVAPRFDHDADGQFVLRADQAEAQELLGNQTPHSRTS